MFPLPVLMMLDLEQDLVSKGIFPIQQSQNSREGYGQVRLGSSLWLLGILLLTH